MKGSRFRLRVTRLIAAGILGVFALGIAHWAGTHPFTEKTLFVVGISLAAIGATGRAWATTYISGQKMHSLVITGPYSLCRNPLYLFNTFIAVGIGFCTETFTMPLVLGLSISVLHYFQIQDEERRLQVKFGSDFTTYRSLVPAFLPRTFNCLEPNELVISPRVMKRGLFGIGFLLCLIGAIEALQGLHQSGLLPTLYRIY
ncbi:MAG: isoprenylcysteine carboxylmethyltransferase family protein [Pirellulales bacterium]